jgi:hypothetical protein
MASEAHSRSGGLNARWGHFAPQLLMISIGAVIALGLRPAATSATLLVSLGLVLFVLATWVMMRAHDRALCEHCLSSMPLNPSEQAGRYRRRFWMSHTGAERRFIIPYMVVLIGSNFFTGQIGRIGWALIQTSMIYLILSYATHRRLQPWCPWCSDGGGGEDRVDTPDPVDTPDTRQLV